MNMTDPVADMISRIRNGVRAKLPKVDVPSSKLKVEIARILKDEGYVSNFKVTEDDKQNVLRAYGAEVVVCPTAVAPEHPDSYYNVSDRLVREIDGACVGEPWNSAAVARGVGVIVLATAQISGRILVTRNIKVFPASMPGIRIPYTL